MAGSGKKMVGQRRCGGTQKSEEQSDKTCSTWSKKLENKAAVDSSLDGSHMKKGKLLLESEVSFIEDEGRTKDSAQLLAIFPEEIWKLISEKLQSQNDLENLSNASPFFRHLLLNERVCFLFPKVFSILAPKYHEHQKLLEKMKSKPQQECNGRRRRRRPPPFKDNFYPLPAITFPEVNDDSNNLLWIFKGEEEMETPGTDNNADEGACARCGRNRKARWSSKILKLRLVCHDWCNVVDKYYDRYGTMKEEEMEKQMGRRTNYWLHNNFSMRLSTSEFSDYPYPRIKNFLEHFQGTHEGTDRNPFLLRKLSIRYDGVRGGDDLIHNIVRMEFIKDVQNLVEKYGRQVWYCDITLHDESYEFPGTTLADYYLKLKNLLVGLSQLKHLNIEQGYCYCGGKDMEAVQVARLTQMISLNPMPILQNVHSLKVRHLYAPVFNEIVRKTNQLSSLIIRRKEEHDGYDFYTTPLPNLKELQIEYFSEEDYVKMENPTVHWPLEKLDVSFGTKNSIDWPRIFAMLENKFGETLTDLEIDMPEIERRTLSEWIRWVDILEDSASYRLNLPRLKSLKVKMSNLSSLDFVLPMKDSLETLEVLSNYDLMHRRGGECTERRELYESVKNGQIIEFVGWAGRMTESNIWEYLPKLKRIQRGYHNYHIYERVTRAEWKKEKKMNAVK